MNYGPNLHPAPARMNYKIASRLLSMTPAKQTWRLSAESRILRFPNVTGAMPRRRYGESRGAGF
jgi:hypothetical protein